MADLKAQLEISADASGVETGVNKAKKSLATLGDAAQKEGKKASDGLASVGDGGTKASAKVDTATKNLIGSIQRTTAALEAGSRSGSKYFETLASQRGVNVDALRPYLAQLDAVTAKQQTAQKAIAAAAPSLDRVGMSAKATAAALRGVPAQFTDIAVSLQAGQNPLTVFLQQGGQLKDMFGGIGPAARALGGYIVGLINPLTLAAAAIGSLGFAYFKGSKEADAFAKALILSGNSAGTTVGELTEMAKSIDAVTGTQAAASEALVEFAANGNIAAKNLEQFTLIAIKLEKEAGQAVSETVKQFAELGKEPVTASLKLNETTRFLTESVYQQIRALDQQGRTAEASATAQKAYADALESRLGQLQGRLGYIERAWRSVSGAAKEAWDFMLGVGRSDTLQEQLGKAQTELSNRMQRGALPTAGAAFEKGNQAIKDRIAGLQETLNLEKRSANVQKEANDRLQNRIAFDKEADKYLSKKVQREREIAKANQLADKAGASSAERAKVIAGIEDRYKDPKGPKPRDTTRVDSRAQALLDIEDIKSKAAEITNTVANTERVLEAQRSAGLVNETDYYAKKKALLNDSVKAQVDALKAENDRLAQESLNTKDGLDRDRKILENKQKIAKLTADTTASQTILDIQAESAIRARTVALLAANQAAQDYFDTLNKQQQRELDSFGKGKNQRSLDSGIAQIEDRYTSQKRDLENNRAQLELEGKFTEEAQKQYTARLAIINDFQAKSISSYADYYGKLTEAQGNWVNGATEALQNYIDEVNNVAASTERVFTQAFAGLEDSITGALMGDKGESWKKLGESISRQLIKGIVQQQITKPIAEWLQGSLKDGDSMFGNLLGGVLSNKKTGENWLGGIVGGGAGKAADVAASTAVTTAQTALATTTTAATAAVAAFSASLTAAASMAGISSAAGGGGGTDILGAFISGLSGRAIGGPVSAGGMYQVNERGPEMLKIGNKQLLMMGSQPGQVTPMTGGGGGGRPIQIYYQAQPGESKKTAGQNGAVLARRLRTADTRNN